ncbi:MAG: carbohydrate kinase family protein [Oscillospiraceae bacterium]|jgi:sugar/nucleoside kinase (ribokinase family)|nr:carbohydrate kinase family protein [Oscillospiraceae bacterium]
MDPKVLCAGHLCLDITPVFHGGGVPDLTQVFSPGRLTQVGRCDIHLGGAVGNTGLAMRFFGADALLCGKIGADELGQTVERRLDGCPSVLIKDDAAGTSYTVVLAVPGHDRLFLHHPGANDAFSAGDIPERALEGAAHLHFGYPPLMRRMYGDGGEELVKIFARAKNRGVTTSLDLAAVDPGSDAGKADWRAILAKVLPLTDYFVPSADELCSMLNPSRFARWGGPGLGEDVKPMADEVIAMGAKTVLIKCGAPGLYYRSGGTEGFQRSFRPSRIASTAGAGDVCIAAFLTAALRGSALPDAARLAAAAGACCVTAYDTLSGLKPLEEMDRLINAGWEPI